MFLEGMNCTATMYAVHPPYVFEYYPNHHAVTRVPLKGCTDPVDPSKRITNTTCEKKGDDCDERKHEEDLCTE